MMRTAFAFGADAVYAGQPRYSLRVRNNEFGELTTLSDAIAEAHAGNRLFYVVSNVRPHNTKVRSYLNDMAPVVALKPDALIMADPGLIDLVRETWPQMPVHLSVQANTVNFAAVRFWRKLGVTRIILSRELSLDEVAEIRQECPDVELEVFVQARCASPTRDAACSPDTSTGATRIRARAPIPAAGTTSSRPASATPAAIFDRRKKRGCSKRRNALAS